MKEEKCLIRKQIAKQKKRYAETELAQWSEQILSQVEKSETFRQAECFLIYYALKDEVQTQNFIERWYGRKRIILPTVKGDILELKEYTGKDHLIPGAFHIEEPIGKAFTEFDQIDLAIIPGVAFDLAGNRLGRGKGFYDRLLPHIRAHKMGICFPFQYLTKIPNEPFDIRMDSVVTIRVNNTKRKLY